jgi:hypothetical protein
MAVSLQSAHNDGTREVEDGPDRDGGLEKEDDSRKINREMTPDKIGGPLTVAYISHAKETAKLIEDAATSTPVNQ